LIKIYKINFRSYPFNHFIISCMNKPIISILGIPTDKHSSHLSGAAKAPPLIFKEFHSEASNKFSENGIDLAKKGLWIDRGNLTLDAKGNDFEIIRDAIHTELNNGHRCISLGGDHSISFPIIDAYHNFFPKLNILHFDAHPDLYENFDNNPYSHASPFARILENHLIKDLVQIGIRTMNTHQQEQVDKYNVNVIKMNDFDPSLKLDFDGPVYVSLDLDGLDPAFAPGVSHPEPGGLSTRDVIKVISNINQEIVGADIVEYNPNKDINNITAVTAAKLLKELMGYMLL